MPLIATVKRETAVSVGSITISVDSSDAAVAHFVEWFQAMAMSVVPIPWSVTFELNETDETDVFLAEWEPKGYSKP